MHPRLATPGTRPPETQTIQQEETEERVDTPWRVILFNDEIHTFDEVILQVMKATGCGEEQAARHAWTVHTRGKDCVFEGPFDECFRVQGVLREIQLVTQIEG
jgi:ATP-dependent Clp protease adaptor protein ClpS